MLLVNSAATVPYSKENQILQQADVHFLLVSKFLPKPGALPGPKKADSHQQIA